MGASRSAFATELASRYPEDNLEYTEAVAHAKKKRGASHAVVYEDERLVAQAQYVAQQAKVLPRQLRRTLDKTGNWLEQGPLSESTIIQ